MRVLIATTCKPDDRKTLCVIRALALSGAQVTVGGDRFLGQAFHSRFLDRKIHYPHPNDDMDGFVQSLMRHAAEKDYDVLLPMCDYTTIALAAHREEFSRHVCLPVPDYDSLLQTRDKMKTLKIAQQVGIEIPAAYCVHERRDLEVIVEKVNYPCVLKPRQGAGGIGLSFPDSKEALIRCYDSLPLESDMVFFYDRPLVQEYVSGDVHDVCLLFNRGQARAVLTQKRLRMYPHRGGVGILNETTDEPILKDKAIRLLEALRWHGPAQVEFKIDSNDGSAKLMEINGRFWGTLDLSVQAGMNFPLMACNMAMEGDIEPSSEYRVGLRYRWPFPFELLYAMEKKGGCRAFWKVFRLEANSVSDFWFRDPLPSLAEALYVARRVWWHRSLRPTRNG